MSEAQWFLDLLSKNPLINYYGETSRKYLELFSKRIQSMSISKFESPDIVIHNNEFLYFFEHFEFDSSENTRKGTELRNENARIERDFSRQVISELSVDPNKEIILKNEKYISKRKMEYYVENYSRNFLKHYNKLELYKNNLNTEDLDCEYEFGFVIENSSSIPDNVLLPNRQLQLLLPINIRFLCELMSKCQEIKNIFYVSSNGNFGKIVYYFRNSIELYEEIMQLNIKDFSNDSLYDWDANSYSFSCIIPNK